MVDWAHQNDPNNAVAFAYDDETAQGVQRSCVILMSDLKGTKEEMVAFLAEVDTNLLKPVPGNVFMQNGITLLHEDGHCRKKSTMETAYGTSAEASLAEEAQVDLGALAPLGAAHPVVRNYWNARVMSGVLRAATNYDDDRFALGHAVGLFSVDTRPADVTVEKADAAITVLQEVGTMLRDRLASDPLVTAEEKENVDHRGVVKAAVGLLNDPTAKLGNPERKILMDYAVAVRDATVIPVPAFRAQAVAKVDWASIAKDRLSAWRGNTRTVQVEIQQMEIVSIMAGGGAYGNIAGGGEETSGIVLEVDADWNVLAPHDR